MKDEEQLIFSFQHDAFAESMEGGDKPAFDRGERRIDGPQEERADKSCARHAAADDPRLQRVQVQENVGQLRHAYRSPPVKGEAGRAAGTVRRPRSSLRCDPITVY